MSVRLSWPTRDDAPIDTRGVRLAKVREAEASVGRLIQGDNLAALRALLDEGLEGKIDLAYLDPPYMSGVDYAREDSDGVRTHAYGDRWSERGHYLDMMWPRLRLLHRLLSPRGTMWVQTDHRASHLMQVLLDELFGEKRLRNAIVWRRAPPLGRQVQSNQFPRNVDTLLSYAKGDTARFHRLSVDVPVEKGTARWDEERQAWFTLAPRGDYTDASVTRLEAEGRIHRTPSGKVYVKYFLRVAADGTVMKPRAIDSMWDDVAPLRHVSPAERTGYPTQKPEKLIERVVEATSDPGDLVLDPFGGSGTTALVAARMGRRFITIDASPVAIETTEKRLALAKVVFDVSRVEEIRL
jgi:DNA modification methylase